MADKDGMDTSKSAKVGRACDSCRVRKIKCDGNGGESGHCTPCNEGQFECTYEKLAPKRGHSKRFVLEKRAAKMEDYLRTIMPQEEFDQQFGEDAAMAPLQLKGKQPADDGVPAMGSLIGLVGEHDEDHIEDINGTFSFLSTGTGSRAGYGQSSRAVLVQEAWNVRQNIGAGRPLLETDVHGESYPWERHIPQRNSEGRPVYLFPPGDLFYQLVDIYFQEFNDTASVLHRPTFMNHIVSGLHLRDAVFGANVLMVCALGARYCEDPRVFLDEYASTMTAGWKWFRQVDISRTVIHRPTLFDIQFYCHAIQFMSGTSNSQACWVLCGIGLRLAQEAGADRRSSRPPNATDELWKRAWWFLVATDRIVAENLGRAPAVNDEDMTQVLPVDCDDEYWETPDPTMAFKQPPGQPSKVSGLIHLIGLIRLLGLALRTIYCVNQRRLHRQLGAVPAWQNQVVGELDTALKIWLEKLPPHLRQANNQHVGDAFFRQSFQMHCIYYSVIMTIHRPLIGSAGGKFWLPSPSLAKCVDAARSCASLVYQASKRFVGTTECINGAAFTSGIVLLLNLWQNGAQEEVNYADMENVSKCIDFLKQNAARWPTTESYARQLELLAATTPHDIPQQAAMDFQPVDSFTAEMVPAGHATTSSVYTTMPFDIDQLLQAPAQMHFPGEPLNYAQGSQGVGMQGGYQSQDDGNWEEIMALLNSGNYYEALG